MGKVFNELSRVQLPAVVHLMKLGYNYISYFNSGIFFAKKDTYHHVCLF